MLTCQTKVVRLNIEKYGENIAYIQGAGDVVPESLKQIGYNVKIINPKEINSEILKQFDAVVIGIRAYNTVEDLKFKQEQLFQYVREGGNMIVQYLKPQHELLNFPNKITQNDFKGWTQERGLYFPDEWGKEFTAILSMNDKGESPKEGSLLVAKHGKGYFIYTGLSFFREFPAGVSGAYRLFANMLSIGKGSKE